MKKSQNAMMKRGEKLVVGLMSGTSLDGIDAVLLSVKGTGSGTRFRQQAYREFPYPRGVRAVLLRNSVPETSRVDEIARLNVLLAELYADAVRRLARTAGVRLSDIELIGSHGQTIHHLPNPQLLFGKRIRATIQIGDPSVLATLTGIPTVGDFRLADMAVGGQGAPLVPYFDWLAFRSRTRSRLLLNIGGISNITILARSCASSDVVAFDTGPGNMLVDGLMKRLYNRVFDSGGATALKGSVNPVLFDWLIRHPYLKRTPPKSTGREEFGDDYLDRILRKAHGMAARDIITTVSLMTPAAVYDAYQRFVVRRTRVHEILVSGGGAKNRFFLAGLRRLFEGVPVRVTDELGMSGDAKEAICFAILANETLAGNCANLPRVTGASRQVVLGKVCRP